MQTDRRELVDAALRNALSACARGDVDAFRAVHALTTRRFRSVLRPMVADEDAISDVLQSAYLSIWQNAGNYDPLRAQALTWMMVIVRNKALDLLRARKRRGETEDIDETFEDAGPPPEDTARNSQLRQVLETAFARLPGKMAMAVRLKVVQGMTDGEVGRALDVPANTVKSWTRRGLERLRRDLPFAELGAAI